MRREISIFAKKRKTTDGRSFYSYITTLPRKDGEHQTMTVKFKTEDVPKPEHCPMNIIFEQDNANIARQTYNREDTGEPATSYTLWLNEWEPGQKFVDHSFDEFDMGD